MSDVILYDILFWTFLIGFLVAIVALFIMFIMHYQFKTKVYKEAHDTSTHLILTDFQTMWIDVGPYVGADIEEAIPVLVTEPEPEKFIRWQLDTHQNLIKNSMLKLANMVIVPVDFKKSKMKEKSLVSSLPIEVVVEGIFESIDNIKRYVTPIIEQNKVYKKMLDEYYDQMLAVLKNAELDRLIAAQKLDNVIYPIVKEYEVRRASASLLIAKKYKEAREKVDKVTEEEIKGLENLRIMVPQLLPFPFNGNGKPEKLDETPPEAENHGINANGAIKKGLTEELKRALEEEMTNKSRMTGEIKDE